MIEFRNVTKTYRTHAGTNVVLDDVSVQFRACESTGILGVNGAGKSTLLRIAGAAELPDAGEVVRNGQVSWPIGFSGGFNSSLTGEENCRFVARIYNRSVDEVTDATADFAELGDYFYMPMRTYSSGMRARLAFGLSMAIDFDVYLVDEVTAVGDRRFKAKCQAAFEERQERSCLVIVSHSLATIRTYCQRCAVMANGKLRVYDSVDEASEAYEEISA